MSRAQGDGRPPEARTLVVVVGLRQEARLAAGPGVRILVGGGRSTELAAELHAALARVVRPAVLSFGVAGALSPELEVGDVLAPDAVVTPDGSRLRTTASWAARLRAATGGRADAVQGSDTVVGAVDDKTQLRTISNACAVDMESHVAGAAAHWIGAPFAVLRVISDRADQSLPSAAAAGLKADGGVDVAAVLRRLLVAPGELPALIRTGREAARAFRSLEAVRRRAGPSFACDDRQEGRYPL